MSLPVSTSPAIERVLSKLKNVKSAGSGRWMARCPAHDDSVQSLSIKIGQDNRTVMFCHAGCQTPAIVGAIGLTMSDLFPPELAKANNGTRDAANVVQAAGVATRPKLVKSYDYYAADGRLVFQTCRLEPKSFRQRRRNGTGEWVWNLEGVTPILYGLPELLEAVALKKRVYVVEGEKDADRLLQLGYVATTSPMGAGKWRETYSDALAGADVTIIPDNDDPGRAHAAQVAASLYVRDCIVRVVGLPNLPPKGDVSDFLELADDSVEQLGDLLLNAPRWTPADAGTRTRWRLDEVWENETVMRPPPPVVPYLAWASRATLLAAREKSGKSTLTGFIAARVSTGGDFLGEPCQRGHVLIVGLEEYIGDTARRLKEFGADGKMITLVDRLIKPATDRPSEVRSHLEAVAPVLVIVDSLIAYAHGMITDANNATQAQAMVKGLVDMCHELGVALIIIHHARKADGKYRDSSAIGGAVDVIAEVFSPEECERTDPNRRRVRPVGRVPARGVDFRFTGTGYELVDAAGPQKGPIDQRITQVIGERPGISANDVCEAVADARQTVLTRIANLIAKGVLINDGNSRHQVLRLPTYAPARALL